MLDSKRMPVGSPTPLASHTFAVVIAPLSSGLPDLLPVRTGFSEVIFPETLIHATEAEARPEFSRLILRRAVSADQFLSTWTRRPVPRDCVIVLITGNQPAAAWHAKGAVPERFSYSSLSAVEPAVLIETLELRVRDFIRVELPASQAATIDETLRHFSQRMEHAHSDKT